MTAATAEWAAWILLAVSSFLVLLPLVLYSAMLDALGRILRPRPASPPLEELPSVSLLIAVRNAGPWIREKVQNSLELDYPRDRLEVVFTLDGCTDDTEEQIRRAAHGTEGVVKVVACPEHRGKAQALHRGAALCTGELLVMTDADALLERDAIRHLADALADPEVGGACGERVVRSKTTSLRKAQAGYVRFDSRVKLVESRLGSITSNDGKLYAIRRSLYREIPGAVTDDLYTALSVVRQGARFVFEPRAKAGIRVPSRSPGHEIQRRRRIVCRSLRAIFLSREVLNPVRFGSYSVQLLINKVFRRLLPLSLLGVLLSCLHLAALHPPMRLALVPPALAVVLAALLPLTGGRVPGPLGRVIGLSAYFLLGNLGMLLGILDFATGRQVDRWDPRKTH